MLRTKLVLAQLPLAAGLALLGFVALRTLDALGRSSQRILQDNYRSVLAAQRMKDSVERVDSAAVFRAAGRPDKSDEQAPPNIRRFAEELSVQEHNITEQGEAEATQKLRVAWDDYLARYERYRQLGDESELRRRYFVEMEPAFVRVKNAAERILELNQDAIVLKSDEARRIGEWNRSLLLLSTLCALGLGLFASLFLTRRALRPLQLLTLAVRSIGEGNLDARARLRGEDEIARVGRELD
ncbi:MAG TPA: HAMP domain-containing protein, partial [Myxococcales bacterium]|nr:HAMP domain-containing protein [Myxococcales bacterium]